MTLDARDRELLAALLRALLHLVESSSATSNEVGKLDTPPASPRATKCSRCHRANDADGLATCQRCRDEKAAARRGKPVQRAERAEGGQSRGQREGRAPLLPLSPFCTSDASGTSAPSGSPPKGQRAEGGQNRGQKRAEGASSPGSEAEPEGREALARVLLASPWRSLLLGTKRSREIRVEHAAAAANDLATAGITLAELRQLINLDLAKTDQPEPGHLLGDWIKHGPGCCRAVLDEQRMKRAAAADLERGRAPAPADAAARGEGSTAGEGPAYGTEPRIASSFVPQLLRRTNGEEP